MFSGSGKGKLDSNTTGQHEYELKTLLTDEEETEEDCPGTFGETEIPCVETPTMAEQTDTCQLYNSTLTVHVNQPRNAARKSTSRGNGVEEQHAALVEVDEILQVDNKTKKIYPPAPVTLSDGVKGGTTDSYSAYGKGNKTDVWDSGDDEPNYHYSDPTSTEEDPTNSKEDNEPSNCCGRSSTNRQNRFKDLLFYIHYHDVVNMETVLDEEDEKNQARLLTKTDPDGLPCLLNAVKRQSVKCLLSLLKRFQKLSNAFEEYHIKNLKAVQSTTGRNLFHIAAETTSDEDILNAIDSCHLCKEIADKEDNNKTTPLIVACQHQNHEMVVRLVNNYQARIDHIDASFYSPMYFASVSENEKTLEFLVQNATKRNINIEELFCNDRLYPKKGTILQAIVEGKNPCAVSACFSPGFVPQQLMWKCLEMELKNDKKFIHEVCETPLVDLVKAAGSYPAKLNLLAVQDKDGVTPLMRATEARQFDVVKTILNYKDGQGTVSLKRTKDYQTALFIACEKGYAEIAQLIVETCTVDLSHQDKNERNVFHHASKHPEVLKVLTDVFSKRKEYSKFKMFLEKPDSNGYLPIHCAAVTGSHRNVSFLLENGVSYDTPSRRCGRVALHYAACTNLKTVKALVEFVKRNKGEEEKKKFIDASDSRSETSLYIAASLGKWKTVSYLLENGASMKRNHEQETPLHQAAASGSIETVNAFLAKHSAAVNVENRVGETAAMFAAVSGHTDVLNLLLRHNAQLWGKGTERRRTCLDWAVENNMQETAIAILSRPEWEKTMKKSFFGADGLLAMMVKTMPNVAVKVLDKCNKKDGNGQIYDFFALQTIEEKESSETKKKIVKSMKAVEAMAELPRDECLRHQVVQKFLKTKWRKHAKNWYLCLLLYVIFLLSLTIYIGFVRTGSYAPNDPGVIGVFWLCICFTIVNIIKELFQLLHKGREYFTQMCSYLEVAMYICVFIFLPKDEKSNLQWQAGAIAIFLGWINFTWFLKSFPTLGIYIIMVKKILITFLKVFLSVLFFIMAFAMTFFVLLHDDQDGGFNNIFQSSVTTFAMMVGEVNYRETFLQKDGTNFVLIMFLVTFLVLMTILVMNLLTGLAVGDTGHILSRAMSEKRVQRALLIVEMDKYLNKFPGMKAEFVEPLKEQSKHDTVSGSKKCFGELTEKLMPSLEMLDREEKSPSECHCAGMRVLLDSIQITLEAVQKSLKENKPSSWTRRQIEHLLKDLKGRRNTL